MSALIYLDQISPKSATSSDAGSAGPLLRFHAPLAQITATSPEDVETALSALQAHLGRGHYAAGYFSYELGYLLEPRLKPLLPPQSPHSPPLLWFGIFSAPDHLPADAPPALSPNRAWAGPLHPDWDQASYLQHFAKVRALIASGDIYQANLSFRARFNMLGDPLALYQTLRRTSEAPFSAYIDDGARQILSLSPELFFSLDETGKLTTKPMKGTAPLSETAQSLAQSAKNRAENLMIVDLLRNDLGRIAETGSVAVQNLFAVETYPTLHAMVSTITAQLTPQTSVQKILHALFPCGSVTGAPKIRAMEILRNLESSPRGVYCGAIGYFAPNGAAQFNVAIRTLTIHNQSGELGIGGGVVWDSSGPSEYAECLLKARYFESARKSIELIETLRWDPQNKFTRLNLHLTRLENSAKSFGIKYNRAQAEILLANTVRDKQTAQRVRLSLNEHGALTCIRADLGAAPTAWTYAISPHSVSSQDPLLRHKTNWRDLYDSEAGRLGCDEAVFCNEQGHLTEASRSNLFLKLQDRYLTPPLSAGLLNGCLRQEMLAQGLCEEQNLTPADLGKGDLFFGNSLRGLILARRI